MADYAIAEKRIFSYPILVDPKFDKVTLRISDDVQIPKYEKDYPINP